jgi:hypothetical protein
MGIVRVEGLTDLGLPPVLAVPQAALRDGTYEDDPWTRSGSTTSTIATMDYL